MKTLSGPSAASFIPEEPTLPILSAAVQNCEGCDLFRNATQAVFGELESHDESVRPKVSIMMIGEQPGDRKIAKADHLLGRRESCSIVVWKELRSIGGESTSRIL
jgi:DNA polymerase